MKAVVGVFEKTFAGIGVVWVVPNNAPSVPLLPEQSKDFPGFLQP
jgi:hypothetical protein